MTSEASSQMQLAFVQILKGHTVLMNKSQKPSVKKEKSEAMQLFLNEYKAMTGVQLSEDKIRKRINNIKTDVKKKTDLKKTGNKPIKLKEWEVIFLELLNADENPSISCIPGGLSVGADNSIRMASETALGMTSAADEIEELPRDSPVTKRRKLRFDETEETKKLTNGELQRMVLLEQLKLIRMQQEEIKKRNKTNNRKYNNSNPTYSSSTNMLTEGELIYVNL